MHDDLSKAGTDPDSILGSSTDPVSAAREDVHSLDSSSLSFSPWSSAEEDSGSNHSDSQEHATTDGFPPVLVDLCKDAEHLIDRLVDLGLMIRRSGASSRLLRADSSFNEHLYSHLRKHLELLLGLSNYRASSPPEDRMIHSTMSSDIASVKSSVLRPEQVHLIQANLRRRHRFAFARKRASTLAFLPVVEEPTVISSPLQDLSSELWSSPVNLNIGPTIAESKGISTQDTATDVDQKLDTKVAEVVSPSPPQEYMVNVASTAPSASVSAMDYPQAPKTSAQRAFKCPCCYQVLGKATGQDRKKWR